MKTTSYSPYETGIPAQQRTCKVGGKKAQGQAQMRFLSPL